MNFADELRKLNKQASDENMSFAIAQARQADAKIKAYKEWAVRAIETVKNKCRKAARKGAKKVFINRLEIYGVKDKHFTFDILKRNSRDNLRKNDLRGKYYYLWEQCEANGLKPEVSWQHDGVGINDWYEFFVTWD